MKVWLVHTDEQDRHYVNEDKARTFENIQDALAFVTEVATGQRDNVTVRHVYEVDLSYGRIEELEAKLEGFKLTLVAKVKP